MTDPLLAPLSPDCVAMRQSALDQALPPVWQLDPETAVRLHIEGNLAARAAWQPPIDTLRVRATDLPADDGRPPLRMYEPEDAESSVVIAWIHGGGWVLGNLDTADAICRTLCDLTGWAVASVDYGCAPDHPFPRAVDDSVEAVEWLLARWSRVVVAGDSAGATLAAVVAQALGSHPALVGQILAYPATDPGLSSASAREFTEGPFLTRRDMEWFYDQYVSAPDRADPRVHLAGHEPAQPVVPAIVLTVGHDPLRDEGIAYARALAAAGGAVEWIHAPDLYHGAFTQAGVLPTAASRVRQVCAIAQSMFS